jgi:hypothetical protein
MINVREATGPSRVGNHQLDSQVCIKEPVHKGASEQRSSIRIVPS